MNFGTFLKQPADVVDYDLDYAEWLSEGDTVASAVTSLLPDGPLVVELVLVSSPRVKIWLSGGTSGTTHKITTTMTTVDGRVRQDEFRVKVKDI